MDPSMSNDKLHGPRVGVAVVVRRENTVLLGQRTGAHGAGEWAFPGGKVDYGEDPLTCSARELEEESGLVAVNFQPLPFWSNDIFITDEKHFVTLFIACDYAGGAAERREPNKCLEWMWAPWPEGLPTPLMLGTADLRDSGINVFFSGVAQAQA
jgi:8-oxo-dGTP diphosphatase